MYVVQTGWSNKWQKLTEAKSWKAMLILLTYTLHKVLILEFRITKFFYNSVRKYKEPILIRTETQFSYFKQERDFIGSQNFKVRR